MLIWIKIIIDEKFCEDNLNILTEKCYGPGNRIKGGFQIFFRSKDYCIYFSVLHDTHFTTENENLVRSQ